MVKVFLHVGQFGRWRLSYNADVLLVRGAQWQHRRQLRRVVWLTVLTFKQKETICETARSFEEYMQMWKTAGMMWYTLVTSPQTPTVSIYVIRWRRQWNNDTYEWRDRWLPVGCSSKRSQPQKQQIKNFTSDLVFSVPYRTFKRMFEILTMLQWCITNVR